MWPGEVRCKLAEKIQDEPRLTRRTDGQTDERTGEGLTSEAAAREATLTRCRHRR